MKNKNLTWDMSTHVNKPRALAKLTRVILRDPSYWDRLYYWGDENNWFYRFIEWIRSKEASGGMTMAKFDDVRCIPASDMDFKLYTFYKNTSDGHHTKVQSVWIDGLSEFGLKCGANRFPFYSIGRDKRFHEAIFNWGLGN